MDLLGSVPVNSHDALVAERDRLRQEKAELVELVDTLLREAHTGVPYVIEERARAFLERMRKEG